MKLTQKNFATTLPKELLKLAEKNTVRECDETTPGTFVAYVDQGNDSFDVSIRLSPNGEVLEHGCDCPDGDTFCRHKTALLATIVFGKKTTTVVKKAKKKETPLEAALADASLADLRLWVAGILKKNKDLEMAFMAHFARNGVEYTPDYVIEAVKNSVKAVFGAKRSAVDAAQVKRLVEVWGDLLRPVLDNYLANPTDPKKFRVFHTLIMECIALQSRIVTSSNKITKFIEDAMQSALEVVNALPGDEDWNIAVRQYVGCICKESGFLNTTYVSFLTAVHTATGAERAQRLVVFLAKQYEHLLDEKGKPHQEFMMFLFAMVVGQGFFPKYKFLFQPVRYAYEYNFKLIKLLVDDGEMEIAKTVCFDQLTGEYISNSNRGYNEILKRIYKAESNKVGLVKVCTELFPLTFNYDDYAYVAQSMNTEERKKWKTKALSVAKNAIHGTGEDAEKFYFRLLDEDGAYKKMAESFASVGSSRQLVLYFQKMYDADKETLLNALIRRHHSLDWWRMYPTGTEEATLFKLLTTTYTKAALLVMADRIQRERSFYGFNGFLEKLKDWLGVKK